LTLQSWNVSMFPNLIKSTFQKDRLPYIIKFLEKSKSDIIALQEVFSYRCGTKLIKELGKMGYHHTGMPKTKGFLKLNSGLMIFSKYPILRKKFYPFGRLRKEDKFSSKGVLIATIETPSGELFDIATTHFQSKQDQKSIDIREENALVIKDKIYNEYRNNDLNHPLIILGDFNVKRRSDEFIHFNHFIKGLGLQEIPLKSKLRFSSDCYSNPLKRFLKWKIDKDCHSQKQVDYIFIDPSRKYRRYARDARLRDIRASYKVLDRKKLYPLSDHHLLQAKLRFE